MKAMKLFSAMSGLSAVHRFSMMKLGNPESVLEHVGFVVVVSNLIGRELNVICPGTVDLDELTLKAMVHDLDELVVGDIPRPTKYHSPEVRRQFKEIESWGVAQVVDQLGLSADLQQNIMRGHAEAKSDVEGLIVEVADILAVAYKVWEEVIIRGNASLVRQSRSVLQSIANVIDKFPALLTADQISFMIDFFEEVRSAMRMAQNHEHPMKEMMVP